MQTPWFSPELSPRPMPDGHFVPARATVPGLRVRDATRTLHVGHHARILGAIEHAGRVTLAANAVVTGPLHAGREAVIGPNATVQGVVRAHGRVVLLAGAHADAVQAGGDVLLLGNCDVGDIDAGGDIIVVGSPRTGALRPGGRVATRAW